jgi:hypothetical protein
MRHAKVLGFFVSIIIYFVAPIHPAFPVQFEFADDFCHFTGPFFDCDYVILLDADEVSYLSDPATQAVLYQQIVATIPPPYGEIVAIFVGERIQQIQNGAGPGGSRVQITLRNGNLYLFDVFGR